MPFWRNALNKILIIFCLILLISFLSDYNILFNTLILAFNILFLCRWEIKFQFFLYFTYELFISLVAIITLMQSCIDAPADLRLNVWRLSVADLDLCRGNSRERSRPSSRSARYRRSTANESQLSRWYSARLRSTVLDRSPPVACEMRLENDKSVRLTSYRRRRKYHSIKILRYFYIIQCCF